MLHLLFIKSYKFNIDDFVKVNFLKCVDILIVLSWSVNVIKDAWSVINIELGIPWSVNEIKDVFWQNVVYYFA